MRASEVLNRYINQTPEENCRMFEELDKSGKGTYFYGWWGIAREEMQQQAALRSFP